MTFLAAELGGVLQAALGIFGMIGGPTMGLYIFGMLYPWGNKYVSELPTLFVSKVAY